MTRRIEYSTATASTSVTITRAASAAARAGWSIALDMVLAVLDRFRPQNMVQVATSRVFVNPLAHGIKHVPLNLDTLIADRWVVQRAQNVINNLVYGHSRMIPSIEHTAIRGCSAIIKIVG